MIKLEKDLIAEAKEFHQEAMREFKQAVKEKNHILIRDACEKGWNAVVLATNYLFFYKALEIPKSHWERRKGLDKFEVTDPDVKEKWIPDRFSARSYYLHQQGFYEGILEDEKIESELEKVKTYIEDIEKLTGSESTLK